MKHAIIIYVLPMSIIIYVLYFALSTAAHQADKRL